MYTSLFYYILVFMTLGFIFRIIGPFIIPFAIAYFIYSIIKNRQRIKAMNDLRKAQKVFKEEWENTTQSQAYQSGSKSSDVIDADYTIKED